LDAGAVAEYARRGPVALPKALWRSAREHDVFRTGEVLHLEFGKLKRMMAATTSAPVSRTAGGLIHKTVHKKSTLRPSTRRDAAGAVERGRLPDAEKLCHALIDLLGPNPMWVY
jgi:hypothetical protein